MCIVHLPPPPPPCPQDYYHDRILQLTYQFPEDASTSNGAPFWSAPKRFPRALVFDPADPAHSSFVQSAAILKATVHNVKLPDWARDAAAVAKAAAAVPITPFAPKKGVKIETDPKKAAEPMMGVDDDAVIEALLGKLSTITTASKPAQLAPVQVGAKCAGQGVGCGRGIVNVHFTLPPSIICKGYTSARGTHLQPNVGKTEAGSFQALVASGCFIIIIIWLF